MLDTPYSYLLIGAMLGAVLNYFHFGFSSGFRLLIVERRTLAARALLWMLGISILGFAFILNADFGNEYSFHGFIRPLSLAIPLGAFLFGLGMQVGPGGCTSGTLNRVGQIQSFSFVTLLFMIIGGTLAAALAPYWQSLPETEPIAFQHLFGVWEGLIVQFLILFTLYRYLLKVEQQRHVGTEALIQTNKQPHSWWKAAVLLALLNSLLLLLTGSPWSIATVFPFWGIQLIELFQWPVDWAFWDYVMEHQSLTLGWWQYPVAQTAMGLIVGSLIVTIVHPRPKQSFHWNQYFSSVIGGLLMGSGAVMASGCNIGALFSGIASGSLHGWLWLAFGLLGSWVGLRLKQSR
ncbi:YeeE/YedE family protein [Thiomicrorhabdus heinhorstiae]|uniref:YeeE/YedE family protein n=1 Tax=Thiomicrorhabdus heinhorstiae TaxID=2748010 RepID=A0ABS0BUZ4_9GAMM|nr:YeeE/YedE family protein [Thiomicrorhabdus heinhorstiae]MBF6057656.1 YeeE/YedE family protein [Thiomicrorhabdus heinhorstiae]